jgi:hypothetical protein
VRRFARATDGIARVADVVETVEKSAYFSAQLQPPANANIRVQSRIPVGYLERVRCLAIAVYAM